jgi:hypothetical protein
MVATCMAAAGHGSGLVGLQGSRAAAKHGDHTDNEVW